MPFSFPLRTTQLIAPPLFLYKRRGGKAGLPVRRRSFSVADSADTSMMMVNGRHIPAFGSWDYCDDLPITQYFESAMQAGVFRPWHSSAEEDNADLFPPAKSAYHQEKAKARGGEGGEEKQAQPRKQVGKVCDVSAQAATARRARAAKAVDEDLYKIPPELLCQKPKKKRLLRSLWSVCLGISCSASA